MLYINLYLLLYKTLGSNVHFIWNPVNLFAKQLN